MSGMWVRPGKTEAADWEKSLMDFFVIIPETRVLMFRLQLGIALPSKVLLDFVIQKWGGNLKNPQITFKNERLDEEVGSFTRRPGTGGGKPGKPCFIISDESFAVGNCGTALCTARWGLPPKPFTRSTTRKAVSSLSLTFSIRGNSPGERVGRRQQNIFVNWLCGTTKEIQYHITMRCMAIVWREKPHTLNIRC